jgi:hypothetical protein
MLLLRKPTTVIGIFKQGQAREETRHLVQLCDI